MSGSRPSEHGAVDPGAVLRDLPDSLWPGVMDVLRRAFDDLDAEAVPRRLRPFLGWRPDRLDRPVVRAAVVASLPADARLRRALGEHVAVVDAELARVAEDLDVERLVERHEPGAVVAALVGADRWADLAVLSERIGAAERRAVDRAGDAPAPNHDVGPGADTGDGTGRAIPGSGEETRRLERTVRDLQAELTREKRRSDALAETAAGLRDVVSELERERDALSAELTELRRRHRERLARLRRQAHRARELAADREARVDVLAEELRGVLDRLTGGHADAPVPGGHADAPLPGGGPSDVGGEGAGPTTATPGAPSAPGTVPREVRAAEPGRPCRLPPGVTGESPAAVASMLRVHGLELLVDGYNVTKDLRGRPAAPLAQQRRWLLRTVAGLCGTYAVRPTVVFDGEEAGGKPPSPRGVRTVFTAGGETADDRIMGYLESMGTDVPVLVVTSDREIREHADRRAANVVSSGTFLKGIGAAA